MIRCDHCDILLTYHKWNERLQCHYCGDARPVPDDCPACNKSKMSLVGIGTEKVEGVVREMFPEARLLRIDLDTIGSRTAFIEAWRKISSGEADVILGTQMIAKGFHLEKVTLVGVVAADMGLFLPDFRAAERTFALLTQVAGRAGRGQRPGEVLVQTYAPQHYAVQFARTHDFKAFYKREIEFRKIVRFPPASRAIAVIVAAKEIGHARAQAGNLGAMLRRVVRGRQESDPALRVFGPAPSPISKLRDLHRYRLLILGQKSAVMRAMLADALARFEKNYPKPKVQVVVDVDPLDML
jgi:primosomal protein N' (replication factor Y)